MKQCDTQPFDSNVSEMVSHCRKIFVNQYVIYQELIAEKERTIIRIMKKGSSNYKFKYAKLTYNSHKISSGDIEHKWNCKLYDVPNLSSGHACSPKADFFYSLSTVQLKNLLSNRSELSTLFGPRSNSDNKLFDLRPYAFVRRKPLKSASEHTTKKDQESHMALRMYAAEVFTHICSPINYYTIYSGKNSDYLISSRGDCTVGELLKSDVYPAGLAVEVLTNLIDACVRLSSHSYQHMDIHLNNILVYKHEAPNIRLHDFGSSRRHNISTPCYDPADISAHYSPELFINNKTSKRRACVGPAQDVWAIAICTLQCVKSQSNYVSESIKDILERYVTHKNSELEESSNTSLSMFAQTEEEFQSEVNEVVDSVLTSHDGDGLEPYRDILKNMLILDYKSRGRLETEAKRSNRHEGLNHLYAQILKKYITSGDPENNTHLARVVNTMNRMPTGNNNLRGELVPMLVEIIKEQSMFCIQLKGYIQTYIVKQEDINLLTPLVTFLILKCRYLESKKLMKATEFTSTIAAFPELFDSVREYISGKPSLQAYKDSISAYLKRIGQTTSSAMAVDNMDLAPTVLGK